MIVSDVASGFIGLHIKYSPFPEYGGYGGQYSVPPPGYGGGGGGSGGGSGGGGGGYSSSYGEYFEMPSSVFSN